MNDQNMPEGTKGKDINNEKTPDIIPITPSLAHAESATPFLPTHRPALMTKRVFLLSIQAIVNAILIGLVAKILIWLIAFVTNLSFYGKFSFAESAPGKDLLGWLIIIVPIVGGLIVGLMARFGHAGIRGHGIPEAMEQVLVNESRINPVITLLKPISSAIAIGTGGPFGAEGPIIATGGAMGSLTGQIMRVTANERKIMLAAGACAGMSAIFGSPLSGLLLAIELLLFEFSPRSIIPVALSCVTADAMHILLFGKDPVFAMPPIPDPSSLALVIYVLMGCIIGVAATYVSKGVFLVEDLFAKTPVHWMWWPAIGAVAVGVIGYFEPKTMGVGYQNIRDLLTGNISLQLMLTFCILKFISWVISLGSGTSGGTLAPLFTIGGGLGALMGYVILQLMPGAQVNMATCALIGMAAMFAGASRALLTSIVFALETTAQPHGLLPLLGACTAAYFVSFFLMKSSIMTEKIERRGVHAPNAYEPDILQKVLAKDIITDEENVLSIENTVKETREWLKANAALEQNIAFVVVSPDEQLMGIVRREDIFSKQYADDAPIELLIKGDVPYVFPNDELSVAVDVMDKYQTNILPVVTPDATRKVIGVLSYKNIFAAYRLRRNEDEIYKQNISLRRRGIRIVLKGRQLFGWEKGSSRV